MTQHRVLLARVGAERFAFPLGDILEVAEAPRLAPVAMAPAGVVGQCDHRGTLVPVLDAGTLLAAKRDAGSGVLLLMSGEAGPMALLVDDVVDMVPVAEAQWRPVPNTVGAAAALLEGVLDLDGTLAALVLTDALRAAMLARLTTEVR